MCQPGNPSSSSPSSKNIAPPDPDSISLPPAHILAHLTDAHCHPTDLPSPPYASVSLGGLASMAVNNDQEAVNALSELRPWPISQVGSSTSGPRVVAAFGYHPWFVHQYSLVPTTKREHYASLFSPKPKDQETFDAVLPLLPDPQPFSARLEAMRTAIVSAKAERLVMVGEIGLDATARVHCETLTPFKTSMAHQIAIATLQLELAASLGVPVSFHCVAASGPTLDLLRRFPNVSVDVHSLGGMSASFLTQVARYCPKAYFSPSLLVTARNREATKAIAAVPRDRILVESDTHDCARCDRLVWGAVLWISAVRGWKVESGGEWELDDEEDVFDDAGRLVQVKEDEVWAVRTLERNWARFIGIAF